MRDRYGFQTAAIKSMAVGGTLRTPPLYGNADRWDCRPILTPKTVLPLFFAIGIIFAPIGGGLLYASAQVSVASSTGGSVTMNRG